MLVRICFIVPLAFLEAAEPPPDLLKRLLTRETESETARSEYAYKQRVRIEELEPRGMKRGEYRELREVIFTPAGERVERMIGKPFQSLSRLMLTEEDFADIRNVQPFLFTKDQLLLYQTEFKGEETIDEIPCWVLRVRPRQILQGMRLFEGLVWASQKDYSVIRMEGVAVPQIQTRKQENLFPRFTTFRKQVAGGHWFPDRTVGDDVLHFRGGDIRMRLEIQYTEYKKFGAESKVTFGEPK